MGIFIFIIGVIFVLILIGESNQNKKRYKPPDKLEKFSKEVIQEQKNLQQIEFRGYTIYQIKNTVNGYSYIGMTNDFERRKSEHFDLMYRYIHKDKKLYKSMNYFREEDFLMTPIVKNLTKEEALFTEAYIINNADSKYSYYNVNREKENLRLYHKVRQQNPKLLVELRELIRKGWENE